MALKWLPHLVLIAQVLLTPKGASLLGEAGARGSYGRWKWVEVQWEVGPLPPLPGVVREGGGEPLGIVGLGVDSQTEAIGYMLPAACV